MSDNTAVAWSHTMCDLDWNSFQTRAWQQQILVIAFHPQGTRDSPAGTNHFQGKMHVL